MIGRAKKTKTCNFQTPPRRNEGISVINWWSTIEHFRIIQDKATSWSGSAGDCDEFSASWDWCLHSIFHGQSATRPRAHKSKNVDHFFLDVRWNNAPSLDVFCFHHTET